MTEGTQTCNILRSIYPTTKGMIFLFKIAYDTSQAAMGKVTTVNGHIDGQGPLWHVTS